MSVDTNDNAPAFNSATDGDGTISLDELKGQPFILYFYPKDNTPGCTKESCAFRDNLPEFDKLNTRVLGISKDPVAKHDKFKAKYELPFTLISDEDGSICEAYGTWVEKNMYGRKYMGIERSTFLIDADGKIQKIWRKVKVKNHVEEVLEAVQELHA